jgi:hypothetical protein
MPRGRGLEQRWHLVPAAEFRRRGQAVWTNGPFVPTGRISLATGRARC